MIAHVAAAAQRVGREIPVSMDLAEPKVRTGDIEPGPQVAVARDAAGKVVARSKNLAHSAPGGIPRADPRGSAGRPTLPLQVDAGWLEQLQEEDVITLHDARSAKRHFTVTQVRHNGAGVPIAALAEGQKNAYIADNTLLREQRRGHPSRRCPTSGAAAAAAQR